MRRLSLSLVYLFGLAGLTSLILFLWPIHRIDTDLWFHLSHGRYLFEHGRIPREAFFSFLSPARTGVVYAWMFQAVLYQLYLWWGYYGALALRAALFLGTALLVIGFLLQGATSRSPRVYLSILCGVVLCVLEPRFFIVRPHMVTYLCLIVFLSIIELRQRWMWLLPPLAVVWCNSHGIAYPILLLICLSYSAEYLYGRLVGAAHTLTEERGYFFPLVLSMAAVYLTPHGMLLLIEPFKPLGYVSRYVNEFTPLRLTDLSSLNVSSLAPTYMTLFTVLLALTAASALPALLARRLRLSHLLLCVGAGLLLLRGVRFTYEAALLVLPLLKANPPATPGAFAKAVPRSVYLVVMGLLMAAPVVASGRSLGRRPRYPFSSMGLPQGVAQFLKRVDVGGNVLSYPDSAGYLQWMIYPRYRIYMDLESNLFTAEDFYIGLNAFQDGMVLKEVLREYDPSFISVPIQRAGFRELIQPFPDYVPVFFDDAEVLYANKRRHPDIAQHYALRVDPFKLFTQPIETLLLGEEKPQLISQARDLLEIYPEGGSINHLVAAFYNAEGAYDRALPYARTLIAYYPEWYRGYQVLGDALDGLGFYDRALAAYRNALTRADGRTNTAGILKQMGRMYVEQRRYTRAYRAFTAAIDVFSPATSLEDLYRLGSTALLAGRTKEAGAILTFLYRYKIDAHDTAFAAQIRQNLDQLGIKAEGMTVLQR